MNALVKHLVKRLAQREEAKKAIGMAEYVRPSCYKTHIYAGMFYIEAGMFCIKAGHEVSYNVYQRTSELYNPWSPRWHRIDVMADIVLRYGGPRDGGLFLLCR